MTEFVANYRRSTNISGKLSYSNLYTSISVLAGHYASYGPKFPVPEKRRKRLMQVRRDSDLTPPHATVGRRSSFAESALFVSVSTCLRSHLAGCLGHCTS